ncbi:hypothetical protein Tco_0673522 [Tanacetum coccineum]
MIVINTKWWEQEKLLLLETSCGRITSRIVPLVKWFSYGKDPKFGRDDVRGWLYKCEQFFVIDNVSDPHMRFANAYNDTMAKMKKVRYVGTIEEYQNAFDKLISKVDLLVDQQISFHINVLQIDVKLAVMMFRPKTLAEMYQLSKIQEVANKILTKAKKLGCQLSNTCPMQVDIVGGAKLTSKYMCKKFKWQIHGEEFVIDVMLLPLGGCDKLVSRVDLPVDQQISFHIDGLQIDVKLAVMMFKPKTLTEMYQLTLFNLEVVADVYNTCYEDSALTSGEEEISEKVTGEIIKYTPQISLHDLNGTETFQTMRVNGHVGKQSLHIF